MAHVAPEPIIRNATGFMAAKLLFAASAIGILERLTEGLAAAHNFAQDRPLCGVPLGRRPLIFAGGV